MSDVGTWGTAGEDLYRLQTNRRPRRVAGQSEWLAPSSRAPAAELFARSGQTPRAGVSPGAGWVSASRRARGPTRNRSRTTGAPHTLARGGDPTSRGGRRRASASPGAVGATATHRVRASPRGATPDDASNLANRHSIRDHRAARGPRSTSVSGGTRSAYYPREPGVVESATSQPAMATTSFHDLPLIPIDEPSSARLDAVASSPVRLTTTWPEPDPCTDPTTRMVMPFQSSRRPGFRRMTWASGMPLPMNRSNASIAERVGPAAELRPRRRALRDVDNAYAIVSVLRGAAAAVGSVRSSGAR